MVPDPHPSEWGSVCPKSLWQLQPIARVDSISIPSTRKHAYWNVHCQACMCHVLCYRRCHRKDRNQTAPRGEGLCCAIGVARAARIASLMVDRLWSDHPRINDYLLYAVYHKRVCRVCDIRLETAVSDVVQ